MNAPIVIAIVVVLVWALGRMGRMSPQQSRRFQRQVLGGFVALLALFFLFHGNFLIGLPILAVGAGLLGVSHLLPAGLQAGQGKTQSTPPAPPAVHMDKAEALNVLGLHPGASADDIKAAHKRLQRANHPDTGGTNYLAGKINQARDVLLKS